MRFPIQKLLSIWRFALKLFYRGDLGPNNQIDLLNGQNFGSAGSCIYCGEKNGSLTTEHIIPYALNGNWTLHEASCRRCADITSNIERQILRGELLHLRSLLNFPTRKRADRPATVKIIADDREASLPLSDCPIAIPFVLFETPGLLNGRPSKPGIDVVGYKMVSWGPKPEDVCRKYAFKKISLVKTIVPPVFARMIAKIAYAYAVARFGMKSILDHQLTPDVILGKSDRIGDIVGCVEIEMPSTPNPNEHVLQPVLYKGGPSGRDRVLAIRVKLFAGCPAPTYEVVIGAVPQEIESLPDGFYN